MPKIFGREVPPILLIGAAGLAIYLVADALQAPAPAAARTKAKVQDKKAALDVEYGPEDYTAQFASLDSASPKDAFRPLIVKQTSGNPLNPSIDNFTYSGMALLNGEPNGLLENSTTGAGDFVKPGQHWHGQWLVVSVTPEQMELKNDIGDVTTLKVGSGLTNGTAGANAAATTAPTNNAPLNPAMVGAIGSPDITVQPDVTTQLQTGPGGRRGGGRGRGGGGRGRGSNGPQGGMNTDGN